MFTVAVFQDLSWADRGVSALVADGFNEASVSILVKDAEPTAQWLSARFNGESVIRLDIKRLGAVLARGTLIPALQGSDAGLTGNGLSAVFGRAGFQPHDGYIYETLVGRGGVLVAVDDVPRAADALAKMHSYGGGNAAIGAWAGRI